MVLRGGFRLVLGLAVALSVAWGLLWLMEAAQERGVLGYETWLFNNMWADLVLSLGLALLLGIASAVACDRIWLRIRARGPRLFSQR